MSEDAQYDELKVKVIAHLKAKEGKKVDTTVNIGKALGVHRREMSKILARMEQEGVLQSAGVMAGVAGYKLKE